MDWFLINAILVLTGVTVISGVDITFDPEYYKPDLDKVKLTCDFADENAGTIQQLRWKKVATPEDLTVYEYRATNAINTPGSDYVNRLEDYDATPTTLHSLVIKDLTYCDLGAYQCSGLGEGANTFSKLVLYRGLMMELDGNPLNSNTTLDQGATGNVKCMVIGSDNTVKASLTKAEESPVEGTAEAIPNSNDCGFQAMAEASYDLSSETIIKFTCTSMVENEAEASISYFISTEDFPETDDPDGTTTTPKPETTTKSPVQNGASQFHIKFIGVTLAMVAGVLFL